jgi:flagellar basal-body rod protein FlgG
MLIDGMFSALSGMNAATKRLQNSANNLANVQTTGFKKSDVVSASLKTGGTNVTAISRSNTPGSLIPTSNPLDLAINGNGFFQVQSNGGGASFTRSGSFKVGSDGRLTSANGEPLIPEINVPGGATQISVDSQGQVSANVGGNNEVLGQIQLSNFNNPSGLSAQGGNNFGESSASGGPVAGAPGDGGFGSIVSGYLESSNVDIAEEMVSQMVSEAAFKANVNVIRASDEMIGALLDIKA